MNLTAPHFHDDAAAREYFERIRWPDGRICPHCGSIGSEYETKRAGRYRCGAKECAKDFSTISGTVMEQSHVPLSRWLTVFYWMCASKKGISATQVCRMFKCSKKTAWFLCHRVRAAMAAGGLQAQLGGPGKVVMVDETYHGQISEAPLMRSKRKRGSTTKLGGSRRIRDKRAIVTLVERGGSARTFHVANADAETVSKIMRENISRESRIHTDGSPIYKKIGDEFAEHASVDHSSGEYVRYENGEAISNNACESYFSVFKRGMRGVYQQCKEKHLHRYLAEFDFRHNNRSKLGVAANRPRSCWRRRKAPDVSAD
jgi:transposase-like protein